MLAVRLLSVAMLVAIATGDEWVTDTCSYSKMKMLGVVSVNEPSRTIMQFTDDPAYRDVDQCAAACCSVYQNAGSECTATSSYYDDQGRFVCKMLHCKPANTCLWSHDSKREIYAAFIEYGQRPEAENSTEWSHGAENMTSQSNDTTQGYTEVPDVHNGTWTYGNATDSGANTTDTPAPGNSHSLSTPGWEAFTQKHTDSTTDSPAATTTTTTTSTEQQQKPDWNWYPDNKETERPKKPEVSHETTRHKQGPKIPTKGLVAGIVLAVLVLLVLMSFLTKQLRGKKHPVYYKPLREEEYQKLTVGDA